MVILPDMVIDQILRRLITTKDAIRMSFMSKQWEDVLCSLPVLEFDEGGDRDRIDRDDNKHNNFINILLRYMEIYNKNQGAKRRTPLVKLRLHMTKYSSSDANVVSELLFSSMERSVKELDISLGVFPGESYYYLSLANLMNADTLTSLKVISLKNIQFDDLHALFDFIRECPFIECLSLDSCSFESPEHEFFLNSLSLQSLEIMHCNASFANLDVKNLETLTIVSSELETVILNRCLKLKHVDISAECLKEITIGAECHDVDAPIDAPALQILRLVCYLSFKLSLSCASLHKAYIEPILVSKEELPSSGSWKHFPELKEFLLQFANCEDMTLYADDFKDLIFPQDFRRVVASPVLPNLKDLGIGFRTGDPPSYKDHVELCESIYWMTHVQHYPTLHWAIPRN